MLTKIPAKITIIVVENREPYYFVTIFKCKPGPLCLFSYQMLASILTIDERSSYYKIYDLTLLFYNLPYQPAESNFLPMHSLLFEMALKCCKICGINYKL